jgi:hypothetical protein
MISRRQFLRWLATLGATGVAVAGYGTLFEPLMRLKIARYDLRSKAWPSGFPLTIAALADLHACRPWMDVERIESIVQQTNALGADIVLLLGDYVGGMRTAAEPVPSRDRWCRHATATGLRTATCKSDVMSSSRAGSVAALCRSASGSRRRSCWSGSMDRRSAHDGAK